MQNCGDPSCREQLVVCETHADVARCSAHPVTA
jgi:hypothetical protein